MQEINCRRKKMLTEISQISSDSLNSFGSVSFSIYYKLLCLLPLRHHIPPFVDQTFQQRYDFVKLLVPKTFKCPYLGF